MSLKIGFAMCGSFCTHAQALDALKNLTKDFPDIIPIVSEISASTDTRFGSADHLLQEMELVTGNAVLTSISDVEPIGPHKALDALVITPATGNTIAKLAAGITDTSVTMAAKAVLRSGRPVILGISTNDGLSANAKNIGELLNRKNYYFVPFGQCDVENRPCSLVSDFEKLTETLQNALEGKQIQPILSVKP